MRKVNTKFFLLLVGTFVFSSLALFALHRLQASNIASALLWQAEQAEKTGDLNRAARFLSRYLEFSRDDIEQRARLAAVVSEPRMIATPRGRSRAKFVIEQVLAKDPQRHSLRLRLARVALAGQQFDAAKESLAALDLSQPDSAEVALCNGEWHEAQNQIDAAAKCYRRAIAKNPNFADAQVRLVYALRQLQFGKQPVHETEINQLVASALLNAPNDPRVLSMAAQFAQEKGDSKTALAYLETGLKQNPNDSRLYQSLARVQAQTDQRSNAITTLRDGIQKTAKENRFDLQWMLANMLLDDSKMDEAKEVMKEIREANTTSGDYLDARCQMQRGRWHEAARAFETLRMQFKNAKELALQIDLYLGACYEQLNDPTQQLIAFRRAVDVDPTSLLARRGMADAYWALGHANEALTLYQQMVQANPNREESARWRVEHARMMIQSMSNPTAADLQKITQELDEAEKQLPQSVDIAMLRAEMLFTQGDRAKAEVVLRKAAEANRERYEPWVSLAALAVAEKKEAEARQLFEAAEKRFGKRLDFRLAEMRFWTQHRSDDAEKILTPLEKNIDSFTQAEQGKLLFALAEAHYYAHRYAEADRILARMSELPAHKDDLKLRMQMLHVSLLQDKGEAMEKTLGVIRKIEGDPATEWSFGKAIHLIWMARKGDKSGLDEARKLLTVTDANRPNWHPVVVARAEIDELLGNRGQAIVNYRRAMELGNRDPQIAKQLVFLLSQSQRYEDAELEIRRMQKAFGATDELNRIWVVVSFNKKDFDTAAAMVRKTVSTDSKSYRDHLWMGQVLSAKAQSSEEAEACFRRATAMGAEQPETWVGLVRHLVGAGKTEVALQEMVKAERALPDDKRALALAQCQELVGQASKAMESFKNAIEKQPHSMVIHRSAADFYLRVGLPRDAEALFRKIMERKIATASEEDIVWSRRGLATSLAKLGRPEQVREALQVVGVVFDEKGNLVESKLAESTDDRLAQARVLAAVSHHRLRGKAIAMLDDLQQKQALQADDQFLLARLVQQQGGDPASWRRTRDLLKQIVASNPKTPRYLSFYANLLVQNKEIAEADQVIAKLEQLEKDRKTAPGGLGSIELRARTLEQRGLGNQAVALLQSYAEQDKELPGRVLLLATLQGRLGNWKEAVDLCNLVRDAGSEDEGRGAAVAILRVNKPSETMPNRWKSWQAEYQRVEKELRDALGRDDKAVAVRLQLADLLELQNKTDEIESLCRQVLAIDPQHLVALNNLAWLLSQDAKHAEEALKLIGVAIEKHGARPELIDTRAMANLRLGKNDESVADLEKVVQEAPTPTRLFHLSRAFHQSSNRTSALAALNRANEMGLNPQQLAPSEQEAYQRVQADLRKTGS